MASLHPLSLASFIVAAICLVGIIVLTAVNKTLPSDLTNVLYVSLGGGAGSGIATKPVTVASVDPTNSRAN